MRAGIPDAPDLRFRLRDRDERPTAWADRRCAVSATAGDMPRRDEAGPARRRAAVGK